MRTNREMFFESRTTQISFGETLDKVQAFISEKYADLLMEKQNDETRTLLKRYMRQFLLDEFIAVEGYTIDTLVEAVYTEMAEFSFLTKYIYGSGIEEINVNAWNDIEVIYSDGHIEKTVENFESPNHAINVLRRMLHVSGAIIDNSMPYVLGHLGKNIRISALKTPVVDDDVGIAVSIRIVNPSSLKREDFVSSNTATGDMLDFLSLCLQYGISICVAGATSSGKTTLAEYLLTTLSDDMRIYTIESGSRELALVKKDENGRVLNRVVHTLARPSENEAIDISQQKLLDMALRFDPDLIVVGEMRSEEAYTAQEAARTGHAVLTTIHSNSAESTYGRMVSLCKRASDLGKDELMDNVTEAFPIVVFARKLQDKSRKIMEVLECENHEDGTREYHSIFRYVIKNNRREMGRVYINGEFKRCGSISTKLFRTLRDNGMPDEEYISIFGKLPDDIESEEGGEAV